jgi:hypothetical protein
MQTNDASKNAVPTPSNTLTPPMAVSRPRSGAQRGIDGDPDPLRLGAGGVDAMPDGVRRPAEPSPGVGFNRPK